MYLYERYVKTEFQEDLKTNSCKSSGPSMTSVDKRLCVGFSGAGDSSAPQAMAEAFQQHKHQKHMEPRARATLREINDRGHIYSCSRRSVCCSEREKCIGALMWPVHYMDF